MTFGQFYAEARSGSSQYESISETRSQIPLDSKIVAVSKGMEHVLKVCDYFATCDETILVIGETGTGKELVGRRLHQKSRRNRKPFVAVNCAAIPPELFEREFFGHARGAYTGASINGSGYVERAEGGTLFLDEIGDLDVTMQPKMLRMLDDRSYYRVGDPRIRRVDIRIVAATNRDLKSMIRENTFREDLYYRLAGLEVAIPPLRQRRQDIIPLLEFFLECQTGRPARATDLLSQVEVECACRHSWPGNAREVYALARKLHWRRRLPCLDQEIKNMAVFATSTARMISRPTHDELLSRLRSNGGNKASLARNLGVARSTLYRWLNTATDLEAGSPQKAKMMMP